MFRKKPEVDWVFLSEEKQDMRWSLASGDTSEPDKHRHFRRTIVFMITMTVFISVGIGAAYAHQEALQGIKVIEQEVQAAVEAEVWVQHNTPHLSEEIMVDDDASSYMRQIITREQLLPNAKMNEGASDPALHIQHTWFADNVAASNLTLTEPATDGGAEIVSRQTRFYRETEQGWLRTQPDPVLWGTPLTLETDHVIWHYRRRDHAAVAEIADEIDSLYVRLLRDYGLAQSMEDDKQVINVQVDALPGLILIYNSPPGPIVVASPSVHLVPVERSDTEILAQTVALGLLKNMWAQAVAQHDIEESWPLIAGVSLWEIWDMGLSLSEWRDDVVQWVYGGAASDAGDSEVELPARYRELCAAHSIWMTTPFAIGIPLHCNSSKDSGPRHDNVLLPARKWYNAEDLQTVELHYTVGRPIRLGDPIIMYTVVDYTVTAYGRERLPDLVAGLGRHDTWETLVPDVYGTSLEEFEQGWRQHVAGLAQ